MNIVNFGSAELKGIREIENKYNVNLPKDYTDFLLKHNGGIVEKDVKNIVKIEDAGVEISIDVLFGIETGNPNSNIDTWMEKLGDDLLEETLIIGDDVMQGFLVLVCKEEQAGVYYWDDAHNFDQSTDEENTYWIAESFSSLFCGEITAI